MSDDVRNEMADYWRGCGAYEGIGFGSTGPAVDLLLKRNIVIPKLAGFVVTEEPISQTNRANQQMVDGEYFSANGDVEYWRKNVTRAQEDLKRQAIYTAKYEAVLAYLEAKEAEQASKNADRRRRQNEIAKKSPYGMQYGVLPNNAQYLIDMIIDLQDAKEGK